MSARGKPRVFIKFFKTREVTKSLQPTGGCFPLIMKKKVF